MLLKVGITKYYKLQEKLLAGSCHWSDTPAKAPYPRPLEPQSVWGKNVFGHEWDRDITFLGFEKGIRHSARSSDLGYSQTPDPQTKATPSPRQEEASARWGTWFHWCACLLLYIYIYIYI